MLTLAAAETISGIAAAATSITYSIFGMELNSGVEAYKLLAQGQLASSAGTLYTAASGTQVFVKSLHLVNTTSAAVSGIKLYRNGTSGSNQILPSMTIPAQGWATYEEDGWKVYNANGEQLLTAISQAVQANDAPFPYLTGRFYQPPGLSSGAAVVMPSANRIFFVPFVANQNASLAQLGCYISTAIAASTIQLAIYANDPSTNKPTGSVLGSTANISSAATGAVSAAMGNNVTITKGNVYWLAVNLSAANIGFVGVGGLSPFAQFMGEATFGNFMSSTSVINGWSLNQTYGTWPSATGGSFTQVLGIPFIAYRTA